MMFFCFCWCLLLCVLDGLTMFFLSFQNSCFCSSKNRSCSRLHTFRRNNHPSPVLSKPQTSMVTKSNKNLKVHGTESTKKNNRLYDFSPRNGVISLISPLDGFFMFFFQCWRVCTHSCIEDVTNFHVSKSGGHPLSKKFTPDGLFHFSLGSL